MCSFWSTIHPLESNVHKPPLQPEVEEEPESGAGTQHVPVEPETPLINQDRLPVGLGSLDPGLFDISIL